jgi:hypothetical protein
MAPHYPDLALRNASTYRDPMAAGTTELVPLLDLVAHLRAQRASTA